MDFTFTRKAAIAILCLGAWLTQTGGARAAEEVTFQAADGVTVHGDLYRAAKDRHGTVLLFHMAGSNAGEYAPIAPRLAALGYDALAIDQRSGGTNWGRSNRTVGLHRPTDYMGALPDLEAALAYARASLPRGPIVVWGSSYSAALVFLLAARHPTEVAALFAFSPGEYLRGVSVGDAAAKVTVPTFVTSATDDGEIAAGRQLIARVPASLKRQYLPKRGVHGAATLRADTNPAGADANWKAVTAFLAEDLAL